MPSGLTTAAANVLIDYSHGTSNSTVPTGAHKLALTTTAPTASTAGTKVSGGTYTDQTVTMASSSGASAASNATLTYSGMPALTGSTQVVGVDEYDSATTPFRWWFAQLTAPKNTNAGDTLTIASGAYTTGITSP